MLTLIKKLLPKKSPFPQEIKGHWYCGSWYMYLGDLRDEGKYSGTSLDPPDIESPATDRVAFNHFHTGHGRADTSGLIEGLIPAIRIGNQIGLYRQTSGKYRKTSFYDGLPWDDGYCIDMQFVKAIKANESEEDDE